MPQTAATPRPFKLVHGFERLPPEFSGAVVAIGNFDGVHLGHRQLVDLTLKEARRVGAPAIAITFEPHPRTIFEPNEPIFRLTPVAAKEMIFRALGFDGMIVVPFDLEFAKHTAEYFVEEILHRRLKVRAAAIGYNFHFGRQRRGTPQFLEETGRRLGFGVFVIPPVINAASEPYSSFRIRTALVAGDIATANAMLGYRWFVEGEIIHGDARGRDLGFPTANMRLGPDCRLRHGIYAVQVRLPDGSRFDGVASYGRRPTFDDGQPLLEVFLFDFSGSLYGQRIRVGFIGWIREEMRFDSVDALIAQMKRDTEDARRQNAAAGPGTDLDRLLAEIR